jgi:peptidyl-tRNA hydrolase, PTH1 family
MIRLFVGLGNPGSDYQHTRHNAGFWFIDQLATQHHINLRPEKNFHGFVGKFRYHDQDVWLLQPQTFMNRSGQAVSALCRFYRLIPSQIVVIHDELDLKPGTAKLKCGGGTGGHNGLKDITAHLGGPHYWRLRLGIGHPRDLRPAGHAADPDEVANFVLKPPRREEQELIQSAISASLNTVDLMLQGTMDKAQMQLHGNKK